MQLRNRCFGTGRFGTGCFGTDNKRIEAMRFFDRTEEIVTLREIRRMVKDNALFTVVTGRRRIGKTSLVWKAYEDEPYAISYKGLSMDDM